MALSRDQHVVFNPHAAPTRQVNTRLHRHHHARLQNRAAVGRKPWCLVNRKAQPVPQTVAEMTAEGFFRIVDRKKDIILVSGFNVYPNEIEDVVATHPKVLEVAAIGLPDERSGEVVKVFVVRKNENLTEQDIIDHCRENLTGYKRPKLIEFRDELPKTNIGKILRRALRDES